MSKSVEHVKADPFLQDALEQRASDLQIEAMAQNSQPWAQSRLMLSIQVAAWLLASGASVLPFALYQWINKPVMPYAVTTSGHVATLDVVDQDALEAVLSRKSK